MDPLTEEYFVSGNPGVEEQTKEETENNSEKPVSQLDKQKTDISTVPEPVNPLVEVKKVLKAISALPKGVFPNIEKFIQEDFSFHTVQREVTTNSQTGEEIAPALTLHVLITQLETALRNIQASNYTAEQINVGYYLTLLFLYGVALTERGKKEDCIEAENKFLVMKMVIQESEMCENFMCLVYFGRGLLRCAQKRYNGALLEFYKSLQEIGDTDDSWFEVDPTDDEDLPTTFKDSLDNFIKTTESNITKETICSYLDCERSCEADILKNTNYKGFFQLMCSKSCCIYFHKICWKKFKNLKYPGESDQSFSGQKCLKDGCAGDMVRMLQCDVPGIVKILFEVVRKDEYITIENLGASYKNLMSMELTDTDIRPKFNLKSDPKGITLQSITGSQRIEVEDLQNDEEELSPPVMEYNIDVKSNTEIQLAEINKDVASIPSESSTESVKDLQEVKSKTKKKKRTKSNRKDKDSEDEQASYMVEKDDQLETEQVDMSTLSAYVKTDTSDAQDDSAAEDKFCSLDELHILDMVEPGSSGKDSADLKETERERLAHQHQLYKLQYECEDYKRQLKTVTFRWQENQMLIKKKEKIIVSLNQQVAFGINKMSKLQRQIHAKDDEIKSLKDQLSLKRSQWEMEKHNLESTVKTYLNKLNAETSRALTAEVYFLQCRRDFGLLHLEQTEKECLNQLARVTHMAASNLESLQLKAAVDSWNAIVADVRNKIAFLRTQYNEQINKVKQGFALSTLPPVQLPPPPPSPEILIQQFLGRPLVKESFFRPILTVPQMPAVCPGVISAAVQPRPPLMPGITWAMPTPIGDTVSPSASLCSEPLMINWERITDRLKATFPQQTRKELTDFLQQLKDSHGKSVSRLTFDEIVYKISQMIEPKKSEGEEKSAPDGSNASPSHTASQPNVPQDPKSSQGSATWEGAKDVDNDEEEEEPCVICHENLSSENLSVLPCAHKFHSQCIRPWLMQQGTCPTCRLHVLLPEEFPGHPNGQFPKI
ncbi:similar to Ubiquitin ligase protein DZIP3 (DAZ-interacting protein 3 homolog) (predicted) [Rattus norvegicus]|uniref:E3 ubiquitin-protein ligase DZIP3 n=2 Tax=Rattus norvegicus TaxID=10116 RepID=A6IQV3_RAT|nr:E3 ubiquitin-protein ligase DZIP3 isoform X4 [Rattus norvegicus]EDM11106.1 similar to Ubiquitin ligase protein DZIP3 (DAZ-interacting protein 3 homolog) (predicted) [Rattus norvegicus]|eukprot:XP_017453644.1 PREDICTED: E3 ubiquitin-protein ligase DZIP3 isoform X4 [Rattus norvegicus]